MALNGRAGLKQSRSARLKSSPAASSLSTGPMSPAIPMSASLPANNLLPMELPLMSSAGASPAKTSVLPERALALQENVPGYGQRSPVWLANWSPDLSSWKTSQHCLLEGLETFSATWPRSGMMLNGTAYQLAPLAHSTTATGFGWWPTPTTDSATDRKSKYAQGGLPLALAVKMFPTPTVCGNYNRKGASKTSGDGLATIVKMYPTPTTQDASNNGGASQYQRNSLPLNAVVGGALNPTWVEWLMGFPLGWTDCAA